ncbi:MAG: spore maturation protein A [Clostridia bacterium]
MFLQWIWFLMAAVSLIYGCVTGRGGIMLEAAMKGSSEAISLIVNLGAGYLLFCGFIEMAKGAGVPAYLNRLLQPVLRLLMPSVRREETKQAITMNLSANVLGLGNAATPMGMNAMKMMEAERLQNPAVGHAMYMLLIVNATSIQLIPTMVLTLRMAAGSAQPNAILLPSLLCTAVSTCVGVALGLVCRCAMEHAHA